MRSELLSISKIFTENLFRIPDYQRGYSWQERQLQDFWNDLEQLEAEKYHYTGVLTLEDVPVEEYKKWDDDIWIIESRHYMPYYVVDGQQRLTTIIIFIQVLLERITPADLLNYTGREDIRRKFIFESRNKGISRSYLFGYEKDNPSYEFLKTKILLEKSDLHSTAEDTIYTHNLIRAKEFFAEKIKPLSKENLEALYTKVTQKLLFNIYTISAGVDVFVAFETMNNRGKPLSHLELLKNRLIFLSTKFQVEPSEREKLRRVVNDSWKTVYHYLGKNKDRPLSDDNFLRTHFLSYFGPALLVKDADGDVIRHYKYTRNNLYQDYLLDKVFTARRLIPSPDTPVPLTVKSIYEYAQSIKECVQIYYQLSSPHDSRFPDAERIELERLRRLEGCDPTILVALYLKEKNTKVRLSVLQKLERLLFLESMPAYISGIDTPDLVLMAVKLLRNEGKAENLDSELENHLKERIKATKFENVLKEWGKRSGGYYSWHSIKYFMFEYEQELLQKSKAARAKLDWKEFAKELFEKDYETVEHIYPQKATAACWRTTFGHLTVKQRNLLRNSLGNLLPLSKPKNSSLRNVCFDAKVSDPAKQVGYKYGCYSEIEVSMVTDWTPAAIRDRGVRLLEFLERRWSIPLGDKKAKVKALGLDFVR